MEAAPAVPAYDGSRDPAVTKLWKKKVRAWVLLSSPDFPPEEQGLRLWEALKGDAQQKILDRDDEELYYAEDGVQVLISTIEAIFGQDEMVDLGDRLDGFFEPHKMRRQ